MMPLIGAFGFLMSPKAHCFRILTNMCGQAQRCVSVRTGMIMQG